MRSQQLLALCGLVLASPLAIAAKLEHDDVPNRCWAACGPVVGISESCDAQHDNDSAELQCICNWAPAKTQIPLCAACITQYRNDNDYDHDHDHDDDDDDDDDDDNDDDDDEDNDALDIVHSCSFSTTTYNAAAATTLSASTTGTGTAASAVTTTLSASTIGTGTAASAATTTDGVASESGSQGSSTTSSGGSASSPTATTDAAAGINAPGALYVAGLVGMLPLAWL